ncbi:hypothetical protein IJG79_02130 [Candidatus Saccharibacteria bacterium]|nr:hypothetical protein [Candidatus Saccharibacteria bacterium]
MKANMNYTKARLESIEATIDRLQLLYEVKHKDRAQALMEFDYQLIDKLVDIFSYEKYAYNFNYENVRIINSCFDLDFWPELSKKKMEENNLQSYLLENYFKPAAKKIAEAFNDARLVATFDRLCQIGTTCLFLEMDEFFTHFFEKTADGEIRLDDYMCILMPSTVDLCEMRSEIYS